MTMTRNRIMLMLWFAVLATTTTAQSMIHTVDSVLERCRTQSLLLAATLEKSDGLLPRTWENGQLKTCTYRDWTAGFFAGTLWYLYELQPDYRLRYYAQLYTERMKPASRLTSTHDVGFMLNSSYGNAYRITGEPQFMDVLHDGAVNLASRFNPTVDAIKSWNKRKNWQYPVIIDNMMNLELLCNVGKLYCDTTLTNVANRHALTTLRNHFRADGSCYHVVSYDTISGKPEAHQTYQGYSDNSAWARGQAWALYGYTMMYQQTRRKEYLDQARRVARFIADHPRLPADAVPYWDFDAPDIPNAKRDASAAAVMASAYIELSQLDTTLDSHRWLKLGQKMVASLSSPVYMANEGELGGFILKHSVANMPKRSEVDVPLPYADYYFVEALVRLKWLYAGQQERKEWVSMLDRIAKPVMENMAVATLKANMHYESIGGEKCHPVSYLEAFGRTVCGIAPWLELGADTTAEGRLRAKYIDITLRGLANAVNPDSPDFLDFNNPCKQPLVDAAFLCQGLERAPRQLLGRLDKVTKQRLVKELKSSRVIKPNESNWTLFASMIEATLLDLTGECDSSRLWHGVNRFMREGWYKGDAMYGDGRQFHLDFYNSIVIHPMLADVLAVMGRHGYDVDNLIRAENMRQRRFTEEQEHVIAPDGSYPAIGRSITYRFGVFHGLARAVLCNVLSPRLAPAQVRSAMTAVMRRQMSRPATFDNKGWLTVGFAGHQPLMSESYINTGSEYMCMAFFLPLGLPATDEFWSAPYAEWTNLKAWRGIDVGADHALRDN